jgi:hypothetical protein
MAAVSHEASDWLGVSIVRECSTMREHAAADDREVFGLRLGED